MYGAEGTQPGQRQHASVRSDGTGRSVAAPLETTTGTTSASLGSRLPCHGVDVDPPLKHARQSVRFRPGFRSAICSVPISTHVREPVQTRDGKTISCTATSLLYLNLYCPARILCITFWVQVLLDVAVQYFSCTSHVHGSRWVAMHA